MRPSTDAGRRDHLERRLARGDGRRRHPLHAGLRYREAVIEVEVMITILGACVLEPDPDPAGLGSRMRFANTPAHRLMITDVWSREEKPA